MRTALKNNKQPATDSLVAAKRCHVRTTGNGSPFVKMLSIPVFIEASILNCAPLLTPAPRAARAPHLSGCSCCRPSLGGPSRGRARLDVPESSHHTRPGHRRGSGGWRDAGRTPAGTRCRSGCPDREPSRPGELHPSPGLDAKERKQQLLID